MRRDRFKTRLLCAAFVIYFPSTFSFSPLSVRRSGSICVQGMALNTFGEERRLLPVVRLGNRFTGGFDVVFHFSISSSFHGVDAREPSQLCCCFKNTRSQLMLPTLPHVTAVI
jgi:hypothetical protein